MGVREHRAVHAVITPVGKELESDLDIVRDELRLLMRLTAHWVIVVDSSTPLGVQEWCHSNADEVVTAEGGVSAAYVAGMERALRVASAQDFTLLDVGHPILETRRLIVSTLMSPVAWSTRYARGGTHAGGSFIRRWQSRLGGKCLKYLLDLPMSDVTGGLYTLRRGFAELVPWSRLKNCGYLMHACVKWYLRKERFWEVPIAYFGGERALSVSKMIEYWREMRRITCERS